MVPNNQYMTLVLHAATKCKNMNRKLRSLHGHSDPKPAYELTNQSGYHWTAFHCTVKYLFAEVLADCITLCARFLCCLSFCTHMCALL